MERIRTRKARESAGKLKPHTKGELSRRTKTNLEGIMNKKTTALTTEQYKAIITTMKEGSSLSPEITSRLPSI